MLLLMCLLGLGGGCPAAGSGGGRVGECSGGGQRGFGGGGMDGGANLFRSVSHIVRPKSRPSSRQSLTASKERRLCCTSSTVDDSLQETKKRWVRCSTNQPILVGRRKSWMRRRRNSGWVAPFCRNCTHPRMACVRAEEAPRITVRRPQKFLNSVSSSSKLVGA